MRRYPVGNRTAAFLRFLGSTLIVAGCAFGVAGTGSEGFDVTVVTAPGEQLAFTPSELRVPEGRPIRLTFRNGSSLAHNLVFTSGIAASTKTIVDPGGSEQLALATPAPGAYRFVCTIHVEMSGTLTVEPPQRTARASGRSDVGLDRPTF